MAVHLQLHRPVPVPAGQLRIVWQGFRPGDTAAVTWTDPDGDHRWEGGNGLRWLQRDTARSGEEWRIDLTGVPGGIPQLRSSVRTAGPRVVGVAVSPLAGNHDDAVLHPGTTTEAGVGVVLLDLLRTATGWSVVALAEPEAGTQPPAAPTGPRADPGRPDGGPAAAPPAPPVPAVPGTPAPHTRMHDDRPTRTVPIPDRLQPAVDAARSSGAIRHRSAVTALVDLSASMRPSLADGQLAAALTAVQALAGASSRSAVAARFHPGGTDHELRLEADPAGALADHLTRSGLVTGDRAGFVADCARAAAHGGLHVVVTDDASLPADLPRSVLTVVLGAASGTRPTGSTSTVVVPEGTVDVPRLARRLAESAAALD